MRAAGDDTAFRYDTSASCRPVAGSAEPEAVPQGYDHGERYWVPFEVFNVSEHLWIFRADKNNFQIEIAVKVK